MLKNLILLVTVIASPALYAQTETDINGQSTLSGFSIESNAVYYKDKFVCVLDDVNHSCKTGFCAGWNYGKSHDGSYTRYVYRVEKDGLHIQHYITKNNTDDFHAMVESCELNDVSIYPWKSIQFSENS